MGIRLKQSLKLGQHLVMTPQLQMAIKLLQLNHLELTDMITQELTENPVLEELTDQEDPTDNLETAAQGESFDPEFQQQTAEASQAQQPTEQEQLVTGNTDDMNWDAYLEDFSDQGPSSPSMKEVGEDGPTYENTLTKAVSLEEHLQSQLSMINLQENETALASLILANLNDDGYLEGDFLALCSEAKIDPEDGEEILKMIQNFDPVGIASRNLKECLLLQARLIQPENPLVINIIENFLPELEKQNLPLIAKKTGSPLEEVIKAQNLIHELEPKPGKPFTESETQYISPDIYIQKVGQDFVIQMNDDGIPRLRISPYYRSVLQQAHNNDGNLAKDYVQEKLRSALWLIRSIQNRQKTIYRVTEAILNRQREFFEKGTQHLKPMVLKDIAADVGLHESTISRVTTNKYVHTPLGTFELKFFFNSSIGTSDGSDELASAAVKDKIKQLLAKEDPKKPLSDQQIADILSKDNVDIARRTVAKYREMMNILPSSKRKKLF